MKDQNKDYSLSVLARLLNYSRKNKEDYQSLLTRYTAERFLYRLGQSDYSSNFILKGAYLLTITLVDQAYRTTKDIDFLKTGNTDSEFILEALKSICKTPYAEDGIIFDIDSIMLQEIREQNSYKGQRAKIPSFIGKAKVVLQIDIGVGDSVFPEPVVKKIPSLLGLDLPEILLYPIETVISEKLEAIVSLGLLTSRMKDFYDIYIITNSMILDYLSLKTAIEQTFSRRATALPLKMPEVFSENIYNDETKKKQWKAFVGKLRNIHTNLEFPTVITHIHNFTAIFWNDSNYEPDKWYPEKGWK